jgi:hypothetical protein
MGMHSKGYYSEVQCTSVFCAQQAHFELHSAIANSSTALLIITHISVMVLTIYTTGCRAV